MVYGQYHLEGRRNIKLMASGTYVCRYVVSLLPKTHLNECNENGPQIIINLACGAHKFFTPMRYE